MTTVSRYTKAIATKILAFATLVSLQLSKIAAKLVLFICGIFCLPFCIIAGIEGGLAIYGGHIGEALACVTLIAVLLALRYGLPKLIQAMDSEIAQSVTALRRPLVYKSRLKYTLG